MATHQHVSAVEPIVHWAAFYKLIGDNSLVDQKHETFADLDALKFKRSQILWVVLIAQAWNTDVNFNEIRNEILRISVLTIQNIRNDDV